MLCLHPEVARPRCALGSYSVDAICVSDYVVLSNLSFTDSLPCQYRFDLSQVKINVGKTALCLIEKEFCMNVDVSPRWHIPTSTGRAAMTQASLDLGKSLKRI